MTPPIQPTQGPFDPAKFWQKLVDEGYSPEEATRTVQLHIDRAKKAMSQGDESGGKMGKLASAIIGFGQGATARFLDELTGAVSSAGEPYDQRPGQPSSKELYEAGRDEQRQKYQQAKESHPFLTGVGEIAGAVATPALGTRAATNALVRAGAPAILRGAATGGAAGGLQAGLYAAGGSEGGLGERAAAFGEAAPIGAAIGAVGGGLMGRHAERSIFKRERLARAARRLEGEGGRTAPVPTPVPAASAVPEWEEKLRRGLRKMGLNQNQIDAAVATQVRNRARGMPLPQAATRPLNPAARAQLETSPMGRAVLGEVPPPRRTVFQPRPRPEPAPRPPLRAEGPQPSAITDETRQLLKAAKDDELLALSLREDAPPELRQAIQAEIRQRTGITANAPGVKPVARAEPGQPVRIRREVATDVKPVEQMIQEGQVPSASPIRGEVHNQGAVGEIRGVRAGQEIRRTSVVPGVGKRLKDMGTKELEELEGVVGTALGDLTPNWRRAIRRELIRRRAGTNP